MLGICVVHPVDHRLDLTSHDRQRSAQLMAQVGQELPSLCVSLLQAGGHVVE